METIIKMVIYLLSAIAVCGCAAKTISEPVRNSGQTEQTTQKNNQEPEPIATKKDQTTPFGPLKKVQLQDSIVYITVNGTISGHDYVDLGLPSGTLWATSNIGTKSPKDKGDEFAWGETTTNTPTTNTKKYKFNKDGKFTKYCLDSTIGVVDSLVVLQPKDDAATVNWGRKWCMPTHLQMEELRTYCNFEKITNHSDKHHYFLQGYIITSKLNGNKLYWPIGNSVTVYWTSSLDVSRNSCAEFYLYLDDRIDVEGCGNRESHNRIRPVVKNEQNIIKAETDLREKYLKGKESVKIDSVYRMVETKPEYPGGITANK